MSIDVFDPTDARSVLIFAGWMEASLPSRLWFRVSMHLLRAANRP